MRKIMGVKIYGEADDDTLEAYNATKVLLAGGADISSTSMSGNNSVVKIGSNTLTIKNAKHKVVDFIDAKGEEFQIAFGIVSLDDNSPSTYTADDSSVDYINMTTRTRAITITGNELGNTILGGSGKKLSPVQIDGGFFSRKKF